MTGFLKGHIAKVVNVVVNEKDNQIITASIDKKIKIWDARTWKCLQTLTDASFHVPTNELSSMTFDYYQGCLVTAGSKIRKWKSQHRGSNANGEQGAGVASLCYSKIFKQILAIHEDESVILWDLKTGTNSFEFKMDDNDSITTAAIDKLGMPILVKSHSLVSFWSETEVGGGALLI